MRLSRSFHFLNLTQFLDALNENLFKYTVIFYLIFRGNINSSYIMAITGALFLLPFLVFSSFGGIMADRFSKAFVIRLTRALQVVIVLFSYYFIHIHHEPFLYLCLFLLGTLSALFGPSKYGSIPELVEDKKMLSANGLISAFTFFGIIIGTSLASFLDQITDHNFGWMILTSLAITLVGLITSYCIEKISAADVDKECPLFVYKELTDTFKDTNRVTNLSLIIWGYAYFLFMGAFIQMNIVPFSIETLGLGAEAGGYFFFFAAVGIGIGSLIASRVNSNLGTLPIKLVGISLGCFLFKIFPFPYWVNSVWLLGLGICAGLYLVPTQTFILEMSKLKQRGRNFGTANFLSFAFAFLSTGFLYMLAFMRISPSNSFVLFGGINLLVAYFMHRKIKT